MALNFEYGVNTGNRFFRFIDNDEEPEDFIATQTQVEEKQTKTAKDSKQQTKKNVQTTTTTTTKTNKENLTTKSTNVDQRKSQSAVFADNNNQQTRGESARGVRPGSRRGGSTSHEGFARGRSQRFTKFDGPGTSSTTESSTFEHGGDSWNNETGTRGGRGRGGARRANFEGGRGRGIRGGRANFNNRNQDQNSQQDTNNWQQISETNFEINRSQSHRDFDQDTSPIERPFEPDNTRRGRGNYRGRQHHGNRFHSDREGAEIGQDDYRTNRRQSDRQPRSFVSGVKAIEKKDGEGAHNWGNPTENPEEHPIIDENETTTQTAPTSKDWAQQVDEAEKQMTLDEYKKQIEAKRRANQEKLPQFKTRAAGEGEDLKVWQKFDLKYIKKADAEDEEGEDEEEEEGSGIEENESGEEIEEHTGKKKRIIIPLRFKPIEIPRGSAGSRGGQRRGGNRFRSNRDEQGQSTSSNQGQQSPSIQQHDEQQSSYRGGQRGGRGDYRRSTRGSRQARSNPDPNAPALDNIEDFPTLPKQ